MSHEWVHQIADSRSDNPLAVANRMLGFTCLGCGAGGSKHIMFLPAALLLLLRRQLRSWAKAIKAMPRMLLALVLSPYHCPLIQHGTSGGSLLCREIGVCQSMHERQPRQLLLSLWLLLLLALWLRVLIGLAPRVCCLGELLDAKSTRIGCRRMTGTRRPLQRQRTS
jgi:hypothetical protein